MGGSSGGSGASVAANFATLAVGQEGFASIRRPAAWNGITGMRTSAGLISRGGVFAGWPQLAGHLGPMARTVDDLVALLDVMVGYDPEDPLTAHGAAHLSGSYRRFLDADKAVEHQPTLIEDGVNPPFVNTKGVPFINTFLVYVPAIVVPAGFTTDELPVGITFMGRPYEDGAMLRLAYAYEQATHHRRPPSSTPPLE